MGKDGNLGVSGMVKRAIRSYAIGSSVYALFVSAALAGSSSDWPTMSLGTQKEVSDVKELPPSVFKLFRSECPNDDLTHKLFYPVRLILFADNGRLVVFSCSEVVPQDVVYVPFGDGFRKLWFSALDEEGGFYAADVLGSVDVNLRENKIKILMQGDVCGPDTQAIENEYLQTKHSYNYRLVRVTRYETPNCEDGPSKVIWEAKQDSSNRKGKAD
jgi:hypothetical protein